MREIRKARGGKGCRSGCNAQSIIAVVNRSVRVWLELDFRSFGDRKTFYCATRQADSFPADFDLSVQIIVVAVRVVMDEAETFDSRFDSQVRSIGKGGVTPAESAFVFLFRVLGVMKQQIHSPAEIDVLLPVQPALVLETQFVVGQKDKGFALLDEFVPISAIGVTEEYRANLQSVQLAMAGFPVGAFAAKIKFGPKEFKVYGEVGCFHLTGDATFQEILSMWTAAERDRG